MQAKIFIGMLVLTILIALFKFAAIHWFISSLVIGAAVMIFTGFRAELATGATILSLIILFIASFYVDDPDKIKEERHERQKIEQERYKKTKKRKNEDESEAQKKYRQRDEYNQKSLIDLLNKVESARHSENFSALQVHDLIESTLAVWYSLLVAAENLKDDTSIRNEEFKKELYDKWTLETQICSELKEGLMEVQEDKSWSKISGYYKNIEKLLKQYELTR